MPVSKSRDDGPSLLRRLPLAQSVLKKGVLGAIEDFWVDGCCVSPSAHPPSPTILCPGHVEVVLSSS